MSEHVVTRVNDGWYVCDKCGDTGSERWAILHQFPITETQVCECDHTDHAETTSDNCCWSDTFDRTGSGEMARVAYSTPSGTEWTCTNPTIIFETMVSTPEGERLVDLRILP